MDKRNEVVDDMIWSRVQGLFGLQSVKKKNLVEFMMKLWVHVLKQNQALRRLKSENEELKSKVMRSMDEQIELQSKLLEAQEAQLETIGRGSKNRLRHPCRPKCGLQ